MWQRGSRSVFLAGLGWWPVREHLRLARSTFDVTPNTLAAITERLDEMQAQMQNIIARLDEMRVPQWPPGGSDEHD